jgi:hypothetical protein
MRERDPQCTRVTRAGPGSGRLRDGMAPVDSEGGEADACYARTALCTRLRSLTALGRWCKTTSLPCGVARTARGQPATRTSGSVGAGPCCAGVKEGGRREACWRERKDHHTSLLKSSKKQVPVSGLGEEARKQGRIERERKPALFQLRTLTYGRLRRAFFHPPPRHPVRPPCCSGSASSDSTLATGCDICGRRPPPHERDGVSSAKAALCGAAAAARGGDGGDGGCRICREGGWVCGA